MNGRLTNRWLCATLGALFLLAYSFTTAPRRASRAAISSVPPPKPDAVNTNTASSIFAAAENLRAQQLAESNRAAIDKYKEAANLWRGSKEFDKAASALRNAGELSQALGDNRTAIAQYQESLTLSKAAGSLAEQSRVLNDLGYLQFIVGDAKEAQRNCNEALRFGRQIGDQKVVAQAISNIGETFFSFGDLTTAVSHQQHALSLWRELKDLRGQSQALVALSYYYANLGEPATAITSLDEALALSREAGDIRGEAMALIAASYLKGKLAQRQEALNSFAAAKALVERIGDRTSLAIVTGGMSDLYYRLGDKEKSLAYGRQSEKLFELGEEKWGTAEAKMGLGNIYHAFGDDQQALAYLREALSLFRQLSMRRLEAHTLRDLGVVYLALKDETNALRSFNEALSLLPPGQDQRHEAYTLNYIGKIYEQQKDFTSALRNYQRALPLTRIAADQAGEVLTLYNLAHLERQRGNLPEAQRQIETSTELVESLRANFVSQDLRATYFATVRQAYELYIDILMQRDKLSPNEGFAKAAFAVSEKARGRSLLESLQEAQAGIREGVDSSLLAKERVLENALNAKADRRMQLLASQNNQDEVAKITDEINKLTSELRDLRDQIKTTSPRYAALTLPQPLDLSEVQQRVLDNNSLLIEYALGDERSYVWCVSREGLRVYELQSREQIENSARRLYKLITDSQLVPGESLAERTARQTKANAAIPSEIDELTRLVLSPLAGTLEKKRLLVIADGALQYIPFQTLLDPDSSSNSRIPLVRTHEIVNEPSASTLALLISEAGSRKHAANTVAVLADPVFELDDPRINRIKNPEEPGRVETQNFVLAMRDIGVSVDGGQIQRLFASREEADGIMSTLPWGTGMKAVGFDANRARVVSPELASYRIVHFATHGVIDNEHPELSGIVLSLFDREGHSLDGFLRLHDIYNLRLPADLIVLSACSTGLGKDVKGEGLIGLTRGFMYAGATGVVASLWKVDDEATAELMKRFYQGIFNKDLTPAAALRDAQMAIANQPRWQSPYYWAGFIIQGRYDENEIGSRWFLTRERILVFATAGLAAAILLAMLRKLIRRRNARS